MENAFGFGPHVTIDGLGGYYSPIYMDDLDYVFMFMNKLPDQIGMTKISQPHVFRYKGLVPEDEGITGTVIIAESHISIHTFPKKNYLFFDIFSCKPFEYERVFDLVAANFSLAEMETNVVQRGKKFPRG